MALTQVIVSRAEFLAIWKGTNLGPMGEVLIVVFEEFAGTVEDFVVLVLLSLVHFLFCLEFPFYYRKGGEHHSSRGVTQRHISEY